MESYRNHRTGAALPARAGSTWRHVASGHGNGKLILGLEDVAVVQAGDLIACEWNGSEVFTFKAQKDDEVTLTGGKDGSEQAISWTGPGHTIELTDYVLDSPNGDAVPVGYEHRYDWAAADISGWATCNERSVVLDRSALPPFGLAGMPVGFPIPLAYWIAPRAGVPGNPDPDGPWFAGLDFNLANSGDYLLLWIADDLAQVALDDVVVDEFTDRTSMAMRRIQCRELSLAAGAHRVRAKVENVPRGHPQNCSFFAAALCRKDYAGAGFLTDWEWTTCAADGWKTLDYAADAPGFTWGRIGTVMLAVAQDESTLAGWSLGFDAVNDSAGGVWPIVRQRFPIGKTPADVLAAGVDSGEIEWLGRPGSRVLDVVVAGTSLGTATLTIADIEDQTWTGDVSEVAGRIRCRDEDGRIRTFGSSGRMVWAEFGGTDAAAVPAVAAAQLALMGVAEESVKVAIPVGGSCDPYAAFGLLWTLEVPDRAGTGTVGWSVVEIVVRSNGNGVPSVAVGLRSRSRHRAELTERTVQRLAPGVQSDATAPALSGQRAARALDDWEMTFSWSGKASELDDWVSPQDRINTVTWCNSIEVKCNEHGGGSVDTEVQLLVNGSPPALPVGSATLTDTGTYAFSDFILLLQPGDWLSVDISPRGDHTTGTIKAFGARMPD